jgi:hypothetical protein
MLWFARWTAAVSALFASSAILLALAHTSITASDDDDMQTSWPAVAPDKSPSHATTATQPRPTPTTADAAPVDGTPGAVPAPKIPRLVLVPLIGIFVIMLFAALYFARDIALPIVLAFLFAITFSPIVRRLQRRGVPPAATALTLVFGLALASFSGLYMLSGPVMQWVEAAPSHRPAGAVQAPPAAAPDRRREGVVRGGRGGRWPVRPDRAEGRSARGRHLVGGRGRRQPLSRHGGADLHAAAVPARVGADAA